MIIDNNNKTKIAYLFRHGETDLNKRGISQGCEIDSLLNENGRKQAEELAEKLIDSGIEYIYSSPLVRAFETAKTIAKKLNINVEKVADLREISYGGFAGLSVTEFIEKLGENFCKEFSKTDKYDDLALGGGESKHMVRDRATSCITNIFANTKYSIIGIASHGFILREFYHAINSKYLDNFDNCGVMRCIYCDSGIKNLEII